jgi:hypothetical protein
VVCTKKRWTIFLDVRYKNHQHLTSVIKALRLSEVSSQRKPASAGWLPELEAFTSEVNKSAQNAAKQQLGLRRILTSSTRTLSSDPQAGKEILRESDKVKKISTGTGNRPASIICAMLLVCFAALALNAVPVSWVEPEI